MEKNRSSKLNIAIIHPDLGIGGAERLIVDAAVELASHGHNVHIFTAHHDKTRCFEETLAGTFPVTVYGAFLPRHVFYHLHAACAYLRCLFVALCVLFMWPSFNVILADQVSVVIPLLKLKKSTKVVFYCHFPDLLLAQHTTVLRRMYRKPIDIIEEITTGMADLVLVNSKFTASTFASTFKQLDARGIKPSVLYPRRSFFFFRVDRAWKYTNANVLSKPVQCLQECSFHHSLNYKWKMAGAKDRQSVMDWKKQKTVTPIWRPVCTKSSSSEVKELQVEFEDLHDVGKCGKQEDGIKVQEVHASISSSALDAQHTHEDGEAANGATDPTFNSRAFLDNDEERAPESGSVHSDEKHSVSVEVGASLMRFIKGKWGSTQKKIEEDMGVKIIFPSSRKEDSIIIEGISTESLTKASERVQVIIDEAVKSPNLDYSHFVSLPLAIHPELVDKLLNFQKSILGTSNANEDENLGNDSNGDTSEDEDKEQELVRGSDVAVKLKVEDDNKHVKVDITNICRVSYPPRASKPSEQKASKSSALSDLGIEKSIFIKPKTFHLTVLMLKLWNKDRVDAAAEVLQSVSSEVLEALDSRPVSVRLKGLEYMRGSLAKARVVYAPVDVIGGEDRLLRACQVIIDAFVEAGLVLEKDAQQKLKLHATVMNARHRKRGQRKRKFDSFDARGIFKQFGSEEWGEYLIREAHLSQRFVYDENGYYHCCASIPFPESTE